MAPAWIAVALGADVGTLDLSKVSRGGLDIEMG
jgi:hypothetical protein